MNFDEFEKEIQNMKKDITESGLNLDEVKIQHTRVERNQVLWAIHNDEIVTYFKW